MRKWVTVKTLAFILVTWYSFWRVLSWEWHDLTLLEKDHVGCHAENSTASSRSTVRSWPHGLGKRQWWFRPRVAMEVVRSAKITDIHWRVSRQDSLKHWMGVDRRREVKDDSKVYGLNNYLEGWRKTGKNKFGGQGQLIWALLILRCLMNIWRGECQAGKWIHESDRRQARAGEDKLRGGIYS